MTSAITWAFPLQHQPSRLIPQRKKRFLEFCLHYRPPFGKFMPVDEITLVQYAAYLARSIKYSSIKSYLSAVRHLHIRNGYNLDFKKYPRLQLICKGITRAQGCSTRVRLPITIHLLKLFFCLLAIPYTSNYDSLMIWAAMTLAFFGFMHLGELTCNSKFSFETHLSPSDVRFLPSLSQPDYMSIQVKISKTDPFRFGHTILIGKTNQLICPVKAMKMYGNQDQHPRAPFSVSVWLPINQRCFDLRN